jgi:hypothetical protein
MCVPNRQLDPKTRRRMMIANIALILGILLSNSVRLQWVHGISQREVNWLDLFTGFCFGLYITIMLFGLRSARRCGTNASEKP